MPGEFNYKAAYKSYTRRNPPHYYGRLAKGQLQVYKAWCKAQDGPPVMGAGSCDCTGSSIWSKNGENWELYDTSCAAHCIPNPPANPPPTNAPNGTLAQGDCVADPNLVGDICLYGPLPEGGWGLLDSSCETGHVCQEPPGQPRYLGRYACLPCV